MIKIDYDFDLNNIEYSYVGICSLKTIWLISLYLQNDQVSKKLKTIVMLVFAVLW